LNVFKPAKTVRITGLPDKKTIQAEFCPIHPFADLPLLSLLNFGNG